MIHLFEQYPLLKERLPYVSLGEFPTPVKHLENLGKEIGTDSLYTKHDGLSGMKYGGNKIRKLEFLLGDALRKGAKEVLTFGYAGSNHALATAVYARELGMKSISVLLEQPNAGYVRLNLLLSHISGADIHHFKGEFEAYLKAPFIFLCRLIINGKFPTIIGPGGSTPIGTLGYENAGLELKHQVDRGLLPEPDAVYVPLGSMGTAVGLTIGLKATGLKSRLVPVRVTGRKYGNKEGFTKLFKSTVDLIRTKDPSFPNLEIIPDEVNFNQDFYGGQYARFTEAGMAALRLVERSEGIKLDGTYTGKAMAALIDHVRKHGNRNEVTLFWNTYNARDFSDAIAMLDYHQLPQSVHRYFEEEVQALDRQPSESS